MSEFWWWFAGSEKYGNGNKILEGLLMRCKKKKNLLLTQSSKLR